MKRTPLRRKATLKRYTAMRKMSPKRKRDSVRYGTLRRAYLEEHPMCEFDGCNMKAVHIHHTKKRGPFYLDVSTFMGLCFTHHQWIHDHENEARQKGLLLA